MKSNQIKQTESKLISRIAKKFTNLNTSSLSQTGSKKLFLFFTFILAYTITFAQTTGCTDPESDNYNPSATIDDGSCSILLDFYNCETIFSQPFLIADELECLIV